LAGARVTIMGKGEKVPDNELDLVRAAYLKRHANAAYWVDFDDFAFYRLAVSHVYYVGGFGAMGWIELPDFSGAKPDPLADVAAKIIDHMNKDHAEALTLLCRAHSDVKPDEAMMTYVDRLGFRVRARTGERVQGVRIPFSHEVRGMEAAREVLVEMVKSAREAASK